MRFFEEFSNTAGTSDSHNSHGALFITYNSDDNNNNNITMTHKCCGDDFIISNYEDSGRLRGWTGKTDEEYQKRFGFLSTITLIVLFSFPFLFSTHFCFYDVGAIRSSAIYGRFDGRVKDINRSFGILKKADLVVKFLVQHQPNEVVFSSCLFVLSLDNLPPDRTLRINQTTNIFILCVCGCITHLFLRPWT